MGFNLKVLNDVDSSLKNISYIYSCKFMYSQDSEQVEVALSGKDAAITHMFEVTQYIQKPINLDNFQQGNES